MFLLSCLEPVEVPRQLEKSPRDAVRVLEES
jgi:hypothetical protein